MVCDRYAYSGVAFSAAKETTSLVTPSPSSSIPNHHHHHHHHDDDDDIRGEDETETTKTWTRPTLSTKWCQDPDRGLPAPDCVLFLDIKPEMAEQRGGYVTQREGDWGKKKKERDRDNVIDFTFTSNTNPFLSSVHCDADSFPFATINFS